MTKPTLPSRTGVGRSVSSFIRYARAEFVVSWRADAHEELRRRFPDVFSLLRDKPTWRGEDPVLTCRGIEYGFGWHPLVLRLAARLTEMTPPGKRPVCVQAKEKFGELRFYLLRDRGIGAAAVGVIKAARNESRRICEECGKRGRIRRFGCWFVTLCNRHCEIKRRERAARIRHASKKKSLTPKDLALTSSRLAR